MLNRREFLSAGLGAAAIAALPALGQAAESPHVCTAIRITVPANLVATPLMCVLWECPCGNTYMSDHSGKVWNLSMNGGRVKL